MAWQLVWVGRGEASARIVAGRLRSHGVRARTTGYRGGRLAGILGESDWAIYVPERQLTKARRMLEESDPGGLVEEPEDIVAANWRILSGPLMVGAIAILVVALVLALARL